MASNLENSMEEREKIAEITDVAKINEMLEKTTDLLERIALEDQLEKLKNPSKQNDVKKPALTTPSTSSAPPTRPKLSSHSFQGQRGKFQRPSTMTNLGKPSPSGGKASITPDTQSTQSLAPPRGLVRSGSQAKEQILLWAQRCAGSHGIPVKNITSSFADGVAFCAIVHYYFPNAFNFEDVLKMKRKERIEFAFNQAELHGGVPQLIEAEDMILMGKSPDPKVMFCYMTEMFRILKRLEQLPKSSDQTPPENKQHQQQPAVAES